MKKSLVLAMTMALGVTASAYAANPFSDVPAGHWAYDSVAKLAAAGVVDGYGDTTFGGDKLMTRYEMAQIVAKAMAKGANVDKLAAEFADELDTLGVRVANLEKKADNVKITGELRYKYVSGKLKDEDGTSDKAYEHDLRSRLWVNGTINDDWSYTGMIQNEQDFSDNKGNEDTKLKRAFVEGKLGGLNVKAGRYDAFFANGNVYDAEADGIEVSYGKDVKVTAFAGKATDATITDNYGNDVDGSAGKYYGAEITGSVGALNLLGGYAQFKDMEYYDATTPNDKTRYSDLDAKIWYVGADMDIAKDLNLSAMYLKGKVDDIEQDVHDKGYVVGLSYKGAEADEAGSWGLWANYYNQGGKTYVAHTTDAEVFGIDNASGLGLGFKGYGVGANYTFAKNIIGNVAYYDTDAKTYEDTSANNVRKANARIIWTDVTFTF